MSFDNRPHVSLLESREDVVVVFESVMLGIGAEVEVGVDVPVAGIEGTGLVLTSARIFEVEEFEEDGDDDRLSSSNTVRLVTRRKRSLSPIFEDEVLDQDLGSASSTQSRAVLTRGAGRTGWIWMGMGMYYSLRVVVVDVFEVRFVGERKSD